MKLRRAAVPDAYKVGDFIELRSEDASSKPWLARVLSIRKDEPPAALGPEPGHMIKEEGAGYVECEWLHIARDAVVEFELTASDQTEAEFYGSREVFLGGTELLGGAGTPQGGGRLHQTDGADEAVSDWNLIESIKWKVHVFPLEQYKQVEANGFQIEEGPGGGAVLEPSRCWYYRQRLDVRTRTLTPKLERIISRVSSSLSPSSSAAVKDASVAEQPPSAILVPENPERLYFKCSRCQQRFESRHSDTPSARIVRLKTRLSQPDSTFVCGDCSLDAAPVSKRTRLSSSRGGGGAAEMDSLACQQREEVVTSSSTSDIRARKLTRVDRFAQIFAPSFEELLVAGGGGAAGGGAAAVAPHSLAFPDARALAQELVDQFDEFASSAGLNPKMAHQKMHEIFQNVKRVNNEDLRRRIVSGEMPVRDLIHANTKDLAPESLKRRREAEQRKYFEQQVLLAGTPDSVRVIRKTHKGIEEIRDSSNSQEEGGVVKLAESNETEPPPEGMPFVANSSFVAPSEAPRPLAEIVATTLDQQRQHPDDGPLVDLPFPLRERWLASSALVHDKQARLGTGAAQFGTASS